MADNGFFDGVHDEPDIVIGAFYFNIGFIGGQIVGRLVVVVVYVSGDNGRSGMNIPCNHCMGDSDSVDIQKRAGRHPGRKTEVDNISKTKAQDVRRKLSELEVHVLSGHGG